MSGLQHGLDGEAREFQDSAEAVGQALRSPKLKVKKLAGWLLLASFGNRQVLPHLKDHYKIDISNLYILEFILLIVN